MITVEEYRKITNDYRSTEEIINKRIKFIESLCRNVIRSEIKSYVSETK
jgi:hypothetical protein